MIDATPVLEYFLSVRNGSKKYTVFKFPKSDISSFDYENIKISLKITLLKCISQKLLYHIKLTISNKLNILKNCFRVYNRWFNLEITTCLIPLSTTF